jgi:hypothetical protein
MVFVAVQRDAREFHPLIVLHTIWVGGHQRFRYRVIIVAPGLPLYQHPHPEPAITIRRPELLRLLANQCVA